MAEYNTVGTSEVYVGRYSANEGTLNEPCSESVRTSGQEVIVLETGREGLHLSHKRQALPGHFT